MIELGKKYQTRDGRAVRILCVDGPKYDYPIIGILGGTEHAHTWKADGRNDFGAGNLDLIPVPERYEGWLLLNKYGNVALRPVCYSTKENAEDARVGAFCPEYWVVAHVTWED